jgi:hypothetical protein
MVDIKEEIPSKLRGTQLVWELRDTMWTMDGAFAEEPVQVVRVVSPFRPTLVRS